MESKMLNILYFDTEGVRTEYKKTGAEKTGRNKWALPNSWFLDASARSGREIGFPHAAAAFLVPRLYLMFPRGANSSSPCSTGGGVILG